MAGRYERISGHDDDDIHTPTQPSPNSPPPSFRSRASSLLREQGRTVNPDLEGAFDATDDESDDEADDRQRLVTRNSFPTEPFPQTNHVSGPTTTGSIRLPEQSIGGGSQTPMRVYGGGVQSDGVFSNLTAKPERNEGEKEEQPPTYEQAAADAAPPYWETTILAPGLGGPDEVYIDGLPVGSFFSFIWNGMISMSFQLVGFLLTYLLHSTHAAKNGSRAGLGITLIQYGFFMKGSSNGSGAQGMGANMGEPGNGYAAPPDPNAHDFDPNSVSQAGDNSGGGLAEVAGSEWVAYILMIVGWLILIRAVSDYVKARRHEQLVLQSPDRGLPIPIIASGEAAETVV